MAIVLALPLLGALLLTLTGHRGWAPELNATMSFATFFAAALLTARVISGGPIIWLGEKFVPDPSNVLLVVLAALHAHRAGPRSGQREAVAALPQHVPAVYLHDALVPALEQRRRAVGRDGGRDVIDRAAGEPVPHAGEPRGGVEVLHPVLGRPRTGPVRHDPP